VRLTLAYGTTGLPVEVPDDAVVVDPDEADPLADEDGAIRRALRRPITGPPLAELVGPSGTVAVVFPDLTRPMPNPTVLPPLLDELARLGAGPERVRLLCATGTHRRATPGEMAALVGPEVVARYPIHDHRADDPDHVEVGEVDGVAVLLDRRWVEADVRLTTGFVEPHFFAGWSGGPKGVCPGLAATATILEAHSPERIADPRSTWLATADNPVHGFVRSAVDRCPPDLSVDVTLDRHRRLTGVFAGPLPESHRAACAWAARTATATVDGPFEVVVTTNGGHPLDRNLYQAVKGLAAAGRVVADGGVIVLAAACDDGLPSGGAFARLLSSAGSAGELARPGGVATLDGWQTQVLGRVLERAEVRVRADGLTDDEVRVARMTPVADVSAAVADALGAAGSGARVCVLPRGPFVVPTVGAGAGLP